MTGTKFKIAIWYGVDAMNASRQTDYLFTHTGSGGGVGGLTLAVALSKYPDIEVEIFEAAKKFTEIGAGIGIWSRTFKALRKLKPGIGDALLNAVTNFEETEDFIPSWHCRKSDQPEGFELFRLMAKGDMMRFHRADFHGILLSYVSPSCKTHTLKRLVSYSQPVTPPNSLITLKFADGSSSSCDLLVGADGVKSTVRGCMMREISLTLSGQAAEFALSCIDPIWSGATAYRTLIDTERLRNCSPHHRALNEPTWYLGKDAFFLVYPISKGKLINFAGFTLSKDLIRTSYEADTSERRGFEGPWVRELPKEEICKEFEGFEKDAWPIFKCIDKGTLWAVHIVKQLPSYYYDRVALIGDAAHGMMPFQGAGAGQSIEDAYLLATVLGDPSTKSETISRALAVYDKLRRPFASDIALRSKVNGQLGALQASDIPLTELGEAITKNEEWAWLSTLDGALHDAVDMLNPKTHSGCPVCVSVRCSETGIDNRESTRE